MDRVPIERLTDDMRQSFQDASDHKKAGHQKKANKSIETASKISCKSWRS